MLRVRRYNATLTHSHLTTDDHRPTGCWFPDRPSNGSHVVLRHKITELRVVVPWHSDDLGRGLTLRIIKSAGLTRDEFTTLLE